MINRDVFFDRVRSSLFNDRLSQGQTDGLNAILDEWDASNADKDSRWLAYMLATTHHETNRTMAPIEEIGKGRTLPYGSHIKMSRKPYTDTPAIFYGRGFVQLTWYENYDRAGKECDVDLLHHPELALTLPIATKILFKGMMEGWFTGKKLADYFSPAKEDWLNARRIINGVDKAQAISAYATNYYSALTQMA